MNLDTYLRYTGQVNDEGFKLSANAETAGRYHTNWLNMMYPRLKLARNLLRDDGVIFVSIDDHEVHNLRHLMDEIFGSENFIANVIWHKVFASKASAVNATPPLGAPAPNTLIRLIPSPSPGRVRPSVSHSPPMKASSNTEISPTRSSFE